MFFMSNLVPVLKAELAQLETELRQDPRWRKIERIRALLQDYEQPTPAPRAGADMFDNALQSNLPAAHPETWADALARTPASVSPDHFIPRAFMNSTVRHLPKVERVRTEIRDLLKRKQIAHRKEILHRLIEAGVMGYEKDPMASLAAYLSGFKDDFVFDGNGNYSLKPD
jgi:hypothetical protein